MRDEPRPEPTSHGVDDRQDEPESGPLAGPGHLPDRRRFLRKLSGDAVVTAGRLAGMSALVGRSLSAAGASVARDFGAPSQAAGDTAAGETAAGPGPGSMEDSTEPSSAVDERLASRDVVPAPSVAPSVAPPVRLPGEPIVDPVERLNADQRAFLAARTSGMLALNDPSGPPYLAAASLRWDGAAFRIPSQLFGARAMQVERDPRASLLLEEPPAGAWVMVTGVASLEDARPAENTVVVVVRPTRFVWRSAGPA